MHQRHADHRQQSRRHQHGHRPGLRAGWISHLTARYGIASRAGCASTTWTTSRCCGTAPTATCTRSRPATTRCATAPYALCRRDQGGRPGRAACWARWCGAGRPISIRRWTRPRRQLVEQPARPPGPRRRAVCGVVSAADAGLRAGAPGCACWTTSTCTSTRRAAVSCRRWRCRDPGAAAALDARAVGPDLRRRELDRPAGGPDPADAQLGGAELSRHQAGDHRIQLGRAGQYQRRGGPGGCAGHLRA